MKPMNVLRYMHGKGGRNKNNQRMEGMKSFSNLYKHIHTAGPMVGIWLLSACLILKHSKHALNGPDINLWKVDTPQERYRDKHYRRFTQHWRHDSSTSCKAPIILNDNTYVTMHNEDPSKESIIEISNEENDVSSQTSGE